ncbi:MAG: glycosyltransferase, partial [Deltaproteobacteria bacterium]|nr:glycosyltransferase [Deltaproteobacteria bacterium]
MNNPPFFTILTTSLNNGSIIHKTLDSIRNQSFHDLEHIVVDGGSSDQTLEILKIYQNTDNMTWISEPDKGIADALNKGLKLARGRYVLVIQADDALLNSKTLAHVCSIIKTEVFDIWAFPVTWNSSLQSKTTVRPFRLLWWHRFRNIFPHQGVFVHRRVFDRIGRFNKRFLISMDYDFFYRALLSRHSFKFETMPVASIGRDGVSSREKYWPYRLNEEFSIQDL